MVDTSSRSGTEARNSPARPSTALRKGYPPATRGRGHGAVRTLQSAQDDWGREDIRKEARLAKVIRDSFTMPVADYQLLGALKERCLRLGIAIKKSELLRAGLTVLARLPDASLAQVADAVESVKTGRPPGGKKKKKKKKKKKAKQKRAKGKRR